MTDTQTPQDTLPPVEEEASTERQFVDELVDRMMLFGEEFTEVELFPYQRRVAHRILQSIILGDTAEMTALQARQSGKTQAVGFALTVGLVLLPKLAKVYPDLLKKFKEGLWIGVFAPTDEQVDTLLSRVVGWLTSDRATQFLLDEELDDKVYKDGKRLYRLKKSGSMIRGQSAHPRAKIESKSYHFVVIDEAQEVTDKMIGKSIIPMLAFYAGSRILIGTPTYTKGHFYRSIQFNKREQTKRGSKQNHFQADWRECAKYNPDYKKFIHNEIARIGEDSDEFKLSYNLEWLLETGMFVSHEKLNPDSDAFIGLKGLEAVTAWHRDPLLVGIDTARANDSTVVTVVRANWDRADPFGLREHCILNWLELHNMDWESQYFQIVKFLENYNVLAVGVDSTGMGGPVAERLGLLLPRAEVHSIPSDSASQSKRWTHFTQLIDRGLFTFPAHAKTRRLRTYKRFIQQMEDLEKKHQGPYMLAQAPNESNAFDDYPDSAALACYLTESMAMPEVEQTANPFISRRR